MQNKKIIANLKKQVLSLEKLTGKDVEKICNLTDKAKIYILGLWIDKQDENFRKGVIKMLEKYKDKIPARYFPRNLDPDVLVVKDQLQNVLESFIEIMELKEKDLETEESDTPKEGKNQKLTKRSLTISQTF